MGKIPPSFPLQNVSQNDGGEKSESATMERISCNLSISSVHFLPILAVWDHRILDNLIAPHANKVEAAFLFDAAQNMQLSQGQVAAKHFHVP